jgi:hypothetical protein
MTYRTQKLVQRIERRLNAYVRLEVKNCGRYDLVEEVRRRRSLLLDFITEEIEKLVKEGEGS